jgi:hypothetical protein
MSTHIPPQKVKLLEVICLGVAATFTAFLAMAVGTLAVDRLFCLEPVPLPLRQAVLLWWSPATLAGSTVSYWWWRLSTRQLRQRDGICASCGYNLTGNTSGICPECGRRATPC